MVVYAQNITPNGQTPIQASQSQYFQTPISATGAVNAQTRLTIPAPAAGMYNYVCVLSFTITQDGTATAVNNVVTTSTNFNAFAFEASSEDVAQKVFQDTIIFGTPATGCAKSAAPGVTTTFVGPTAITNAGQSWKAGYYQAP